MSTKIKIIARDNGAEENKYAVTAEGVVAGITASDTALTAFVDALIADTVELTKLRNAIDALPA